MYSSIGRSEIHVKPKSSGVQQVAANISITPMPCVRDLAIYINGDLSMRSTDGFELLCRPPSTTLDSLVCACSHGPDAELCCLGALPPGLRQRCAGRYSRVFNVSTPVSSVRGGTDDPSSLTL